jgi:hypothetical protein
LNSVQRLALNFALKTLFVELPRPLCAGVLDSFLIFGRANTLALACTASTEIKQCSKAQQ